MKPRGPSRAAIPAALLLLIGCGGGHHGHAHHHDFSDAAHFAKRWDTPERDAWQKPDAVLASLGLRPDSVVADIGAGTGYFTVRLARAVPEGKVYAVDVEPKMLAHIEARAKSEGLTNIVTVQASPGDPKLPEAVDLVFVCNTYHHIDARTPYFQALSERLREGGRLVVVDYRPDFDGPGPPAHIRIPVDQLAAELAPAGYVEASRETELVDRQYIVVFKPRR